MHVRLGRRREAVERDSCQVQASGHRRARQCTQLTDTTAGRPSAAPWASLSARDGLRAGWRNHAGDEDGGLVGVVDHPAGADLIRRQADQIGEIGATALAPATCVAAGQGVETDGAKRLATDAAKSSVLLGRYSMYRTTAFSFDRHDELQNRLRLFTQPTRQRKTLQQRHLSHIRSAIATFKIVTSLRPQAISPTAAAVSCPKSPLWMSK